MENKFDLYEKIKQQLHKKKYLINPYREISYGIQFLVFLEKRSGLLRIYEGKSGLKVDYSQIKDPAFLSKLKNEIEEITKKIEPIKPIVDPNENDVETFVLEEEDPVKTLSS